MKNKKQFFASIALLIAAFFWGLSYSVQSMCSGNLGTYAIVFLKGIGSIILLPFVKKLNQKFTKKTFVAGITIGLILFVSCVLQQIAIETTSISNSSFITSLYIVLVPIMGIFVHKKPKTKVWFGVVLAAVGLYLLCIKQGGLTFNKGDIYALIGSIGFALQIILIDRYANECDVIPFTCVQQLTVSACGFIMMLFKETITMADITTSLLPLLYIVFVSGLVAQIIQNICQKYTDPTVASILMSFESVFGALGGWLILNQTLTVKEIIGCVLIFVAVLISQ